MEVLQLLVCPFNTCLHLARISSTLQTMQTRPDPNVGPTVVAPKAYEPGEIVLCDKPLILVPPLSPKEAEELRTAALAKAHGLPSDFFHPLEVSDCLSTDDLRSLVEGLHSPLAIVPSEPPVPLSLHFSKIEIAAVQQLWDTNSQHLFLRNSFWQTLAKSTPKGAKHTDPSVAVIPFIVKKICSFLHGLRVNTHSDETTNVQAVFPTAAKFCHSCDPNTFWHFERDPADDTVVGAVHIATRPIAKGELLSFSYVGTGMNLLCPTLLRRQQLAALNFVCRCSRCSLFDKRKERCRLLRCVQCKTANPKFPFSVQLVPTQGGWFCDVCSEIVPVAEQLLEEESLRGTVMAWFYSGSTSNRGAVRHAEVEAAIRRVPNALEQRKELMLEVQRRLGDQHYLVGIAAVGFIRCAIQSSKPLATGEVDLITFLNSVPSKQDCLKDFFRILLLAHGWFEQNMKRSPQHVKMQCLASEMVLVVLNTLGMDNKEDTSRAVLQRFRETVSIPMIKPFAGMKEFKPLVLTVDEVFHV